MQIISPIYCSIAIAVFALSSTVRAQNVDLCAIARSPSQFCGKMITIRATTWHSVDGGGLESGQCRTVLSLQAPEKSKVPVPFKLRRDESWQTFTHYDAMSSELSGYPSPQPNYLVTATFRGLFACRRELTPWYFLVLESVSDVKVEPN